LIKPLFLVALLLPAAALAAQTPLQAAQQAAALHKTAAAAARAQFRADTARAAILAEQQIAAAAALRTLETRTATAATALATLNAQFQTATAGLAHSEAALAKLLPIMQRMSTQPAATLLAMPGSPADAIRGIIIMQTIAGEIETQAQTVRQQSAAAAALLRQSIAQQAALTAAVAAQQKSESALNRQISAAKSAEMADAAQNLTESAAAAAADKKLASLNALVDTFRVAPASPAVTIAGGGGAPVAGAIIERFGDTTIAGPATGVSYRAAPGARVVTPCAGPVLFANKFQNLGMVVIVDCGGGYDFVLSGLTHLDAAGGQRLARGQPVGEMRPYDARNPARQPVLYVELRQNGAPVDPAAWLGSGGSG
jgi:septal ring factor EnvC (AmiA/AmiB activator)